jgi:hypothetical protein
MLARLFAIAEKKIYRVFLQDRLKVSPSKSTGALSGNSDAPAAPAGADKMICVPLALVAS